MTSLEPRELRAETEVHAVPEGEVRVVLARQVELVGAREDRGVAIRSADQQADDLALAYAPAADVE